VACLGGAGQVLTTQSGQKLQPDSPRGLRRYEALLEAADLMVHHRGLPELFHELAHRIQKVVDFQLLNFSLHNSRRNHMDMHLWEGELESDFPTHVPVAESTRGWVWEHQEPLLFRDLNQETRFPLVLGPLRARGFRTYFMMPLTTAEKRLGALGVATRKADAYVERDQNFLLGIAELAALAVENALTRAALLEEKQRLQALVDINRTLASSLEMQSLLPLISECVTRVVPHDFAGGHFVRRRPEGDDSVCAVARRNQVCSRHGGEISLEQTLSAGASSSRRRKRSRGRI